MSPVSLDYMRAASLEERDCMRTFLALDTREFATQVAVVPGLRSFPSQMPPP